MIEQRHFDEAERILAGSFAQHSPAFLEGQRYALAWCLAGKPPATHERNRETACPYERRTAERDAWQSGWASGHATAVQARIVKAPGVIHELPLPQGGHVLVTEPELGVYAWEVADEEGETLREAGGYPFAAVALRDALEEAATAAQGGDAPADDRLVVVFSRFGPSEETRAWLPREAAEFVALVREGRAADPQEAALAWLMMRHGEVLLSNDPERDNSAVIVGRHVAELRAAGAETAIDVDAAQAEALLFRANIETD